MTKSPQTIFEQAAALHQAGQTTEAARLFEAVLAAEPRNLAALQHVAIIHANRGNFIEAEQVFQKALAIDPASAENYNNLGRIQTALNQHQRAIASLRQALALKPDMVEAEFNLGALYLKLGQREKGIARLRRTLERRPGFSEALCLLAGALNETGAHAESVALLQDAITKNGKDAALHHALGRIYVDQGEFERARVSFQAAIARNPAWGVPYYDLSQIHRFAPSDPCVEAMKRLLRNPAQLSLEGLVGLHMALHQIYAGAGEFDTAFSYLLAGNRIRRKAIQYDEGAATSRRQAIARVFDAKYLAEHADRGCGSRLPVFVVGFPRSGTTLIEQILASHPDVHGAGELPFVGELARDLGEPGPPASSYGNFLRIGPEEFARQGEAYVERLSRLAPRAARIVDKMPINYLHLGFVHLMLPQAAIVHVRRNAMDTCLSCFENDFGDRQAFSYDLGELGRCHAGYRTIMEHWLKVLPAGRMLEIDYEDLVSDAGAQARRLVAYCGLEWDDKCLRFHETRRAVFTQSQTQVRRPLYSSSVGRWRLYERHLGPLAAALGSPVEQPGNDAPAAPGASPT